MSKTHIFHSIARWVFRLAVPLVSIAGLIVVLAWMAGTFRSKIVPTETAASRRLATGLERATAERVEMVETIDAVGSIQPSQKTNVASQLLATINDVPVHAGDRVDVGQVLVVLDDREIEAQLGEAEAAAAVIGAELAVRRAEFERYRLMFGERAVTKEEFDRVQGAFQAATAQLQQARERIRRIRVMLSHTRIKANSADVVADRYVDPGDLAVPGKPLLTLHEPSALELHASVGERLTDRIRVGMELPVRISSLDRDMLGEVREIVPQAQIASRSVIVKVKLPADQLEGLYIGMFGRLSIPVGQAERVVVPQRAIRRVGQLELVEVVTPDKTLERRFVRTGISVGKRIEVLSGIDVGETVALPAPRPGDHDER
ncbi:MAG: efflux RND transporter periplasmic adaptor subunit [Pirellulales bacterium]